MNALLNHVWGKSSAQDRIWAQVTGLAPRRAVGRLLMALNFQAFIDESESKEEFILGGHIAPAAAWADFSKEWEDVLSQGTRASNGSYHFKMTEMAQNTERMERVRLFYKIIEENVTASISCRINLGDLRQAQARLKDLAYRLFTHAVNLDRWKNPYAVAFRILVEGFHQS